MRAGDIALHSLRSLRRRRLRSILTTFGIFVGIVTIVALVALAAGVQREIGRNVEELGLDVVRVTPRQEETGLPRGLFQATRTRPITPSTVEEFRSIPGVTSVEPVLAVPAAIDLRLVVDGREVRVAPTTATRPPFAQLQPSIVAGTSLGSRNRGIVVSKAALNRLSLADAERLVGLIGSEVQLLARTQRGESERFAVTIVGVDDSTRPEVAIAPGDAAAVLGWWFDDPDVLTSQGYDSVILRAGSLGIVPAISEQVTGRGYQVNSVQAILDVVNKVFAILQAMLAAVGGLALFVASLGVANTMLMAVYERTREIGIMKATGASRFDVLRLFLVEAGLMGLVGGLTGLFAGWLLSLFVDWIAHVYMETQQITFVGSLSYVPLWLGIGSVGFAVMIGIVAGLYPAFRAASLDPVAALRHD